MRIGIDASWWASWRGFGRFTRGLVRALVARDRVNEYVLVFDASYADCRDVPAAARHVVVETTRRQRDALGIGDHRPLGDVWRLRAAFQRERLDIVFVPAIDGYVPLANRCPLLVTIHDTIPERYPRLALPHGPSRWRRRLKVWAALRHAAGVVTGSRFMQHEIAAVFGLPTDRVAIVPYGADRQFRPPDDLAATRATVGREVGQARAYALAVAGHGAHKNLHRLLEAFARVAPRVRADLVLVGAPGEAGHAAATVAACRRLDLGDRVRLVPHQTDAALTRLYQGASVTVVASLFEGYGLPGVESVACGTPVIATRRSPLPDLLGDAAAAVDPLSVDDLAAALVEALSDGPPAVARRHAALARAGSFGWEHAADHALVAFERFRRGP